MQPTDAYLELVNALEALRSASVADLVARVDQPHTTRSLVIGGEPVELETVLAWADPARTAILATAHLRGPGTWHHQHMQESIRIAITPAPRYFRHWAESVLGEGVALMELKGEWVVRQVEIYGPHRIWCDESGQSDDRFMLADQPISVLELDAVDEISAGEFEDAWNSARESSGTR